MCGIAGIVNFSGRRCLRRDIKNMCDAIAHRGPDNEGFFIRGNVALGHRRLNILDLTPAANQPMLSLSGRTAIVYNGEVYNFQAIKARLAKRGYKFNSRADTEVVLNSFEEWGRECVKIFNGMFAFAVWDEGGRTLTLARDRYGIKPLYYWMGGNTLLFASEIKAFFSHPSFRCALDYDGLMQYFTFQNIFNDSTLFRGVKIVPAGHIIQFCLKEQRPSALLYKYWDFPLGDNPGRSSGDAYTQELEDLFMRAVQRQLVSDVEVGAFLSGGIDSSSIAAIASRHIDKLKTFCVGFDLSSASGLELSFDERQKAEHVSYLYRTEHYEMVLKAGDMMSCLPSLVWAMEDLRLGQSYPNFYAAKLASKFVKVCLSGIGGDELFAGYPWRYYRNLTGGNFSAYISGFYKYWQRLVPAGLFPKLFSPMRGKSAAFSTEEVFRNVFPRHIRDAAIGKKGCINCSLYLEAKTFLHGLFIVEDKLSMAHSLEVRVPFLDNDLVDFSSRLPLGLKLKNIDGMLRINENELAKTEKYFEKMRDGKFILRKALGKYAGKRIANQYKQGFCGPDASWFKGESISYVRDMLLNKNAGIYDYLDYRITRRLIEEHLEGKFNRRLFVWSLLCFEWWLKIFLKGERRECRW